METHETAAKGTRDYGSRLIEAGVTRIIEGRR
jgi:hypothetical protein